ncbi:MAG: glycosyltransferase, partial [Pseudomonadota bacterium]
MRVLVVHNAYQQRGGEDSVVEAEVALLRDHGHDVELYLRHNDEVDHAPRLKVALQALWSSATVQQIQALVAQFRPEVIHVHNTLPLVSPSVYWAAHAAGIPVVQTLHNFRLMCPQATFLRHGKVCEDCLGKVPWRAVIHRCYRESAVQTGAVAVMLSMHRGMGTFENKVSRYIALNEFCKAKFVAGGLPADRIVVKPNFVSWVPTPQWDQRAGGLYVGRLSIEKGIQVLLEAIRQLPDHRVVVVGSGPFESEVRDVAGGAYAGFLPLDQIMARLSRSAFLVLPSICYEGFPRTLVEAFANGVPVIASRLGSMAELI